MKREYWAPAAISGNSATDLEARACMAWELISRFGLIAGKDGGEDSTGRAKTAELPAKEVVCRAFDIADEFVDECERRGAIKANTREGMLDHAAFAGEMARVQSDAHFRTERDSRQRSRAEHLEIGGAQPVTESAA